MPRDCDHLPGAHRDVACPLCKDLELHGKAVTKTASKLLNQQPKREKMRACPRCKGEAACLVTRQGVFMCAGCAEDLDDE